MGYQLSVGDCLKGIRQKIETASCSLHMHAQCRYVYPPTRTYAHRRYVCTHSHMYTCTHTHTAAMCTHSHACTHAHTHTAGMCTHSHTHTRTTGMCFHTHAHVPYTLSLHKIKMNLKEREKIIQAGTSAPTLMQ